MGDRGGVLLLRPGELDLRYAITWLMRFGFCAVLLIGLMLTRVNGSE
jgi:hypothetical protein